MHRLTAALALFVRLSPWCDDTVRPLLQVLQTQEMLRSKLRQGPGWEGEGGVGKQEVRELIAEIADKLC